jgi:hypothetical protein
MSNGKQNICNTIAFICQPGEIEIKSILLAYSLRKNLKIYFKPVVLIPSHCKSQINSSSFLIFSKLNVEVCYFENPFICNKKVLLPGEGMSNKFYGLSKLSEKQNILFLDSDIICLNNFPQELFLSELAVKPAGFSLNVDWVTIYKIVGIDFPKTHIKCTIDEFDNPPYFNTGVVFINKKLKANLCQVWKEYFLFFSKKQFLEKKLFDPFHRDQLTFALTTEKLGVKVILLDKLYNFYARRRKIIPHDVVFVHYHDCYTIASRTTLLNIFKNFIVEYPEIKNLMNNSISWRLLANQNYIFLRQLKFLKSFLSFFRV